MGIRPLVIVVVDHDVTLFYDYFASTRSATLAFPMHRATRDSVAKNGRVRAGVFWSRKVRSRKKQVMPLQNRVNSFGGLDAVHARGAWLGNRGTLHNDDQQIVSLWRSPSVRFATLTGRFRHRTTEWGQFGDTAKQSRRNARKHPETWGQFGDTQIRKRPE